MAVYSLGRRRVIALLVLTSVLLITLDLRGNALIERARGGMAVVLTPFDSAARAIARPITNAWNGISNYEDLERENEALREEIARQKGAEIEYRAGIIEMQELLTLNQLTSPSSYPRVTARVQGEAPSNFQNTVEIDKGSRDGIGVGMPVVNGGGLVGKITAVYPTSAVVLLVTDPTFNIGVKVLVEEIDTRPPDVTIGPATTAPDGGDGTGSPVGGSTTTTSTTTTTTTTTAPPVVGTTSPGDDPTGEADDEAGPTSEPASGSTTTAPTRLVVRETGIVTGRGNGEPLVLGLVDNSSTAGALQVGATVQTAGGAGSIAPPGLPVGTISNVTSQRGTSTPLVEVESSAGDLSRLNFLTVLLYDVNASG